MQGHALPYLVTQWRFSFRIAPAFFVVAVIFMIIPPSLVMRLDGTQAGGHPYLSGGLLVLGNLAVLGFLHVMHASLNGYFYKDVTGGQAGASALEAHP
jgi:hypothetical protein